MAQPQVFAMVLAGGEGKRLAPLTADRAKPAVPFGGATRGRVVRRASHPTSAASLAARRTPDKRASPDGRGGAGHTGGRPGGSRWPPA